ncbi:hypothetical protein [Helicobacter pullorum]|uniref:hypothetical protein n=1 Tax=Helicobacter pullorum TaxID=35818 RepID=UPI000816AE45|nr:hypothetical protein [Helicobacter pullorum]OCR16227.1 hypothetical protein BA915_03505 [Helicobacter pullorum]
MVQYWLIVIAAVLVLFFVVQLLAQYQIIHKKSKIFLGIVLLLIAVGIGIFTAMQDKQDVKMTNLAQLFLQGKELICIVGIEKLEVSKETFNFISGTLTLVGREDSPYFRKTIPLKACDIKE